MRSRIAMLAFLGVCVLLGPVRRAPAVIQCVGDCDADGTVRIDELLTGVQIALGAQPLDACAGLDQESRQVGVPDIMLAIANALGGCPFSHVDYVIFGSYNGVRGAGGMLSLDLIRSKVGVDHWTASFSYSPQGFGGPGTIFGMGTADFVRANDILIFDLQAHIAIGEPFV